MSFFALFADYCYGEVTLALDTTSNAALQIAEHVDRVNKSRAALFTRQDNWRDATYFMSRSSDRITCHTPSAGLFAFPDFFKIKFQEWESYFRSDDFTEDYHLENRVIVLFWKVLNSLVEQRALQFPRCSRVLWIGFEFQDSPMGLVVTHRVQQGEQRVPSKS